MREKFREKSERNRCQFPNLYPNLELVSDSFSFFRQAIGLLLVLQIHNLKERPSLSISFIRMNESRIYPLEAKVVHNGNEETRQIQRQIGRSRKYESWKPPDCEQFENLWHVAVLPWMIVKGRVWIDGEGERNQTNQILGVLGFDYSVSRKGTSTFSLLSSCWISTNCSSNPKLLPIYSLCLFLAHHYSFACDPCLFMDCFEMPFKRDLSYLIWTSCNPTSKAEEADVVNGVLESSNLAEEALDEVLAEEACEENVKLETPLRGLCCTKKFNNIHTKVTASINKRCQDCAIIYCKRAGYMLLIHENILSYLSKEDEVISDEEFTENVEMLSKIEKATSMMEETCLIGTLWRGIDVIMRPKQKLVVEWGFVKDDIEAVDQANNWLNPSLWSPKTWPLFVYK